MERGRWCRTGEVTPVRLWEFRQIKVTASPVEAQLAGDGAN